MTASDYQMAFNKYVADGYRLVWVNGYTVNGSGRYTAIWEKSPGPEWIARYGLSAADYQRDFDSLVKQGYRLKLVSVVNVSETRVGTCGKTKESMSEASRKEALHRRALLLEWFTVFWNVIEAGVAILAGVIAGSTALVAFGADSLIEVTMRSANFYL